MTKRDDLRQISYQEFGVILAKLEKQVKDYCTNNNLRFDLIVPILRSGGFPGLHLASKLKIMNILPAQYKYEYLPEESIVKKFEFPNLVHELPQTLNILVTDSNTVWGAIARKVVEDVVTKFPSSTIYFASVNLDQSIKELPGVEKIFYGELSNEKGELSKEEASEKGIPNDVIIFPWENIEEQWEEINASQS